MFHDCHVIINLNGIDPVNHRQIINGRLRNHRAEEAGSMLGEKKSVQMSALIPFHVHTYTIIINHVCLTCILKGGT